MNASLKVEGLKEAQRALKAVGGSDADARKMNRDVADEVIVPAAKRLVPERKGTLKSTIDSDSTAVYGYILAGSRGDVEYAGVIHFGWATRGLGGNLTGTAKERRATLRSALEQSGRTSTRTLTTRSTGKAARYSLSTATRGRVRGGPIKPTPFIYEAIDERANDVYRFYEQQIEHRAEIEGLL